MTTAEEIIKKILSRTSLKEFADGEFRIMGDVIFALTEEEANWLVELLLKHKDDPIDLPKPIKTVYTLDNTVDIIE